LHGVQIRTSPFGDDMKFPPDDSDRRKWQDPEAILTAIGVQKGHTFVDVGCGEGFFSLPAARIVGPEGIVFGIDINPNAIDRLKNAAAAEGMNQLHALVGKAENTLVCEGCANIIFYGICLHDFQNPMEVLSCARRMIRDDGLVIDLDWKAEPTPIGPPLSIRFSVPKARELIEEAGFATRSVRDAGPWHYCIRATPEKIGDSQFRKYS
jgi:ubiquinone/menaquinone biosynthesis C-methylase UbiE